MQCAYEASFSVISFSTPLARRYLNIGVIRETSLPGGHPALYMSTPILTGLSMKE
jgi:hypothetical protein